MRATLVGQMILPVDLNIQLQIQTNKVQRVRANRMLAAKLLTKQPPRTNQLPNILSELIELFSLIASEFDPIRITVWFVVDGHR